MQDQWWQDKAEEVQSCADSHSAKKFFRSLKTVYGVSRSGCSPLLPSGGTTLIKDQVGWRERLAKHVSSSSLLNRSSAADPAALNQIPNQPVPQGLDQPPSIDEIKRAILQTNSGRAPVKDGIPAEHIEQQVPTPSLEAVHDVLQSIWEEEKMSDDFLNALIVSLSKNDRSRAECGKYRGVSLLSIDGKIFARVILNRLAAVAEQNLPKAQCGFRPGRCTVNMIFVMRQLREKCTEHKPCHSTLSSSTWRKRSTLSTGRLYGQSLSEQDTHGNL